MQDIWRCASQLTIFQPTKLEAEDQIGVSAVPGMAAGWVGPSECPIHYI